MLLRHFLPFALLLPFCAPNSRAESLKITNTPSGATVELAGTTPFEKDFPGGFSTALTPPSASASSIP